MEHGKERGVEVAEVGAPLPKQVRRWSNTHGASRQAGHQGPRAGSARPPVKGGAPETAFMQRQAGARRPRAPRRHATRARAAGQGLEHAARGRATDDSTRAARARARARRGTSEGPRMAHTRVNMKRMRKALRSGKTASTQALTILLRSCGGLASSRVTCSSRAVRGKTRLAAKQQAASSKTCGRVRLSQSPCRRVLKIMRQSAQRGKKTKERGGQEKRRGGGRSSPCRTWKWAPRKSRTTRITRASRSTCAPPAPRPSPTPSWACTRATWHILLIDVVHVSRDQDRGLKASRAQGLMGRRTPHGTRSADLAAAPRACVQACRKWRGAQTAVSPRSSALPRSPVLRPRVAAQGSGKDKDLERGPAGVDGGSQTRHQGEEHNHSVEHVGFRRQKASEAVP